MGFLRDRQLGQAAGLVEVGWVAPELDPLSGAVVHWQGEPTLLVHATAMYLDEVLLRDRRRDALRLLEEFEAFLQASREHDIYERLGMTVHDEWPHPPTALVRVALMPTFQARSTFEPKMAVAKVLHNTVWAIWNKTVKEIEPEAPEELEKLRDNLLYQCAYYREAPGALKYRKLGQAVIHAAQRGNSDRLAGEIGALAGLTGEQFRALPEAEREQLIDEHTRRNLEALRELSDEGS